MEPIENMIRRSKEIPQQQVYNVPPELCNEILARLPAKSLLKFRSVCKSWCSLIDDPGFVSKHIATNKDNRENTYMLSYEAVRVPDSLEFKIRRCDTFNETMSINHAEWNQSPLLSGWTQWSHVNGLLLTYNIQCDIFLCNPSIRLGIQIPLPPNRPRYVGLGFHSSSNDYKVVALMYPYPGELPKGNCVWIYSLKTGLWMNNAIATPSLHSLSAKSIFLRGAIHWIGFNKRGCQVLSFHVASEEFSCIELPKYGEPRQRLVFAVRETLALADIFKKQGCVIIWVMEKYGVVESWTKRHRINIKAYLGHVYVQKTGELWFFRTHKGIISYNTEIEQTKFLLCFDSYIQVFTETYLESLVLFKGVGGRVRRVFMSSAKSTSV